jgi:hypothetical protein
MFNVDIKKLKVSDCLPIVFGNIKAPKKNWPIFEFLSQHVTTRRICDWQKAKSGMLFFSKKSLNDIGIELCNH